MTTARTDSKTDPARDAVGIVSTGGFGLRYFRDVLNGNPTWFECMNGLGPSLTPSPKKAARFETKEEAGRVRFSMGAMHSVCFDVELLPNDRNQPTPVGQPEQK